jgi:DNA (cytosine-5)-methyltransferase 1
MGAPATVIDLFCGAGGFSLGFHAAGSKILAGVDADETASRTFSKNFTRLQPDVPPYVLGGEVGDMEGVSISDIAVRGKPDVLIGGPPCQGFSRAGRAKLDSLTDEGYAGDARNDLYRRFLDAAKQWQPKLVVMENVPGMLSVGGRSVADEAAEDLVQCGFRTGYAVLNASWYGLPQFRERLFFVGVRRDLGIEPSLPPATHSVSMPAGYIPPSRELFLPFPGLHRELDVDTRLAQLPATSVRDAIGDLPPLTDHLAGGKSSKGDFRKRLKYGRSPNNMYGRLMRSWPGSGKPRLVDHVIRRTPRDYLTFKRMRPGDRYPEAHAIACAQFQEELTRRGDAAPPPGTDAYEELKKKFVPPYPVATFRDKWRKLIPDQPSWTVPAHLEKDAYSHIHYDDDQARAISIREAARLQSFPDSFSFVGNMGDCYRQVGNAVPPLLAWAIAAYFLPKLGFECRRPPFQP